MSETLPRYKFYADIAAQTFTKMHQHTDYKIAKLDLS